MKIASSLFFQTYFIASFFLFTPAAIGADYSCEVMTVKGQAFVISASGEKQPLKEGDLLKAGQSVLVEDESFIDLAYDSQWNNVSRLGPNSSIKIQSIYPTALYMDKGDVLAKLQKLPAKSTFEIETPTAIAAVRGSEYRTVHKDGQTDVYNLHSSEVEVYGKDAGGVMMRDPVILREYEKTAIQRSGSSPKIPERMPDHETRENRTLSDNLKLQTDNLIQSGRAGKIQNVVDVEKTYAADLEQRFEKFRLEQSAEPSGGAAISPGTNESRNEDGIQETGHLKENKGSGGGKGLDSRMESMNTNMQRSADRIVSNVQRIDTNMERNDAARRAAEDRRRNRSGGNNNFGGNNPGGGGHGSGEGGGSPGGGGNPPPPSGP